MIRAILILAAVLAAPAAQAIDLPVKVPDGAVWTQTIVHTRTDARDGTTQTLTSTQVIKASYHVEAATRLLRQEFVSFDVDGAQAEQRATLAAQAKLVYPAELEVDAGMAPMRVRAWDAMRELIFKALAATVSDARAVGAVKASFEKMDAAQAATLFKEQGLVGLGQGTSLGLRKPKSYESEVPNLFGGPGIRAAGTFLLETIDAKAGRAVVSWSQALDPTSLTKSLNSTMEAMVTRAAPEKAAEARAQVAGLTLDRQERCRFEIDIPTGLSVKTDCEVELKSGVPGRILARTERWLITQTLPGKP